MNTLTISGNLVDNPQKGKNTGETVIANFRIGNNERVGEESVLNGFFDIVAFNATATNALASLKKGDQVVVVGRLDHRTFEREDGTKGSRTQVIASVVAVPLTFGPITPARKQAAE